MIKVLFLFNAWSSAEYTRTFGVNRIAVGMAEYPEANVEGN